jgi:hypothetical protein
MTILKAFNNHFMEFVDDVQTIFPNDKDIKKAKTAIGMLKRANPKMIIMIWKQHITAPYKQQIEDGDLSFFLNKDYSDDVNSTNLGESSEILSAIDRLREPIRNMGEDNQQKSMKYIQNLTKLSDMY